MLLSTESIACQIDSIIPLPIATVSKMLNKIDTLEASLKACDSLYIETVDKYDFILSNKNSLISKFEEVSIMWQDKIKTFDAQLGHERTYSKLFQEKNLELIKENEALLKKNTRLKRTKNIIFWTAVGLISGATAYIVIRQ